MDGMPDLDRDYLPGTRGHHNVPIWREIVPLSAELDSCKPKISMSFFRVLVFLGLTVILQVLDTFMEYPYYNDTYGHPHEDAVFYATSLMVVGAAIFGLSLLWHLVCFMRTKLKICELHDKLE